VTGGVFLGRAHIQHHVFLLPAELIELLRVNIFYTFWSFIRGLQISSEEQTERSGTNKCRAFISSAINAASRNFVKGSKGGRTRLEDKNIRRELEIWFELQMGLGQVSKTFNHVPMDVREAPIDSIMAEG